MLTIGSRSFAGDESLGILTLPKKLKSIEEDAFYDCRLLTLRGRQEQAVFAKELNLPFILMDEKISVRELQLPVILLLKEGQQRGLQLTVIPEEGDTSALIWRSTDNTIAQVDEVGRVTACAAGAVEVTAELPNTGIKARTFVVVASPVLPDGEYIHLPAQLREVSNEAFAECAFARIDLRDTAIQTIGDHAFWNAKGLVSLILPGDLKDIAPNAFEGCPNLVILCPEEGTTLPLLKAIPRLRITTY